jgi:hypothetical protein
MTAKRLARSSTVTAESFPESALAVDGMVGEPGKTDTKLSWVGESGEFDSMMRQRLYLKDVAGRGPGPRRAVEAG